MGGPQDRTYSVHPQHMQVNYPRNITDDALMACQEAEPPPGPLDLAGCPTDMLFLIRRIRLAEISRATADALPLGSDVDEMAYDKCLELYSAFEAALGSFSTATEQNSVPYRLVFQHHILLLAAHARCARLFRRFLHLPEAGSPEASQHDERFRLACRRSARAVLETALVLLQDSLEREAFGAEVIQVIPYAHRSGCIINHLFMACTLLATDPALAPTESGFGGGTAAEETRALLMRSCRLLERVSEASAMAASMVHSLVGVFRRHGIRPTEVEGRYNSAPTTDALQYLDHQTQQPLAAPGGHTLPAPESPIAVANPDHEASDMGLVEIWDDLMNSSATPTSNRWNQLFLDLDILGGSVEI